jgi:hypothetical protein
MPPRYDYTQIHAVFLSDIPTVNTSISHFRNSLTKSEKFTILGIPTLCESGLSNLAEGYSYLKMQILRTEWLASTLELKIDYSNGQIIGCELKVTFML